mgnify:CR=1 FL=1
MDAIRDVGDRMIALFRRDASARGCGRVNGRDIVVGADAIGRRRNVVGTLAARVPMGQATTDTLLLCLRYRGGKVGGISAEASRHRHRDVVEFQLSEY